MEEENNFEEGKKVKWKGWQYYWWCWKQWAKNHSSWPFWLGCAVMFCIFIVSGVQQDWYVMIGSAGLTIILFYLAFDDDKEK